MTAGGFRNRESAQVVVLFAIALIAMLALLGVAVDGGTLYIQRRTAQNAADAAALAGVRALQQTPTGTGSSATVPLAICQYVTANNFGVTPSVTAYFVDVNGARIAGGDIPLPANCAGLVSSVPIWPHAAGVHVDVTEGPYNTYLVGIVGLRQLSANGGATAQVWDMAINANYIAPWAVCGHTAPIDTNPDLRNILSTNNTILQTAINSNLQIILQSDQMDASQSSQSWLPQPPACPSSTGSSWKGTIDPGNGIIILPDNLGTVHGNGSIDDPCAATSQSSGPCYLFVPVTDDQNTVPDEAHIVTFACMLITQGHTGADKWWGTLEPITTCPTYPYQAVWTYGSGTANTIVALTS
jgi:hypothetical protein